MANKRLKQTVELFDYISHVAIVSEGNAVDDEILRGLKKNVKDSWSEDYPNMLDHKERYIEWLHLHHAVFEKNQFLLGGGREKDWLWEPNQTCTKEYHERDLLQNLLERAVRRYTPKTAKQRMARSASNFFARHA